MKGLFIAIAIGLLTLNWACSDDDGNQLPVIEPEERGVFEGKVTYQTTYYYSSWDTYFESEIEIELDITFPWVRYGKLDWMTTNLSNAIKVKQNMDYEWELKEWKPDTWVYEEDWSGNGKNVYDTWVDLYNSAFIGCQISHEPNRNPIDLRHEIEENYATFGCLYTYELAESLCPEGWRIPTDEDWQALEKAMGMSEADLKATDWRGAPVGTLLQQEEGTMLNLRTGGMGDDNFYFTHVYGFYWTSTPVKEKNNSYYCRQISYNSGGIARTPVDKSKMLSVRYVRDAR